MHSHLHFLVFSLLFFPSLGQQQAPPPSSSSSSAASDDVRSLLEFKKGIQADPSGLVLDTWVHSASTLGSDGCPRSWHGVNCDDAGSVVAISLNGLGLAGELKFSTLTAMASLKTLSLSNNSFTGRLVPALGSITSLQHLDLSGNHFYGPIPGRIADLWGLVHLNLSSNNFTGGFPGGIRNLQQLRVLDLRWNGLWGDVRMLLSELRNPEYVDLSGNAFYGELQMDSGNLSSLANTVRYVNMSWNKLNGGFFSGESLRMFHNLELLDVGHNQITGELPSLDSLTNLKVLRAGNNMLYGSLPEVLFGNAMSVTELDLSRNGFTGSIFSINSTSLKVLNLSSNALSGPLPPSTGSCIIVDLSKNMITGDLAPIQSWGDLETIDLSSNLLSGNFPNLTSQFVALTSIKIRNNSIVGVLPSVLGSYPRLSDIDFSMNKLTGPLLPSLLTSLTLTSLNLSGNHFTGTIPLQSPHSTESLVLPSYTHMEFLDLSDNSLSGSLPPEIVNLQRLKLLDLGMNSLSGQIPTEINKLSSLEFLDLSQNQLKGTIPDLFQSSLKVFNVSNNDLSGLVPQNLKRFPSTSFFPGNALLIFPDGPLSQHGGSGVVDNEGHHHHLKSRLRVALIIGSIGAVVLILFTFMAVYKIRSQELCGRSKFRGQIPGRDVKLGRFSRPNIFRSHKNDSVPMSMSFSNDHLLTSASRSMSGQKELVTETVECVFSDSRDAGSEPTKVGVLENCPPTGGWKSSPGSPLASSPHFVDPLVSEQPVVLDVHSPDRLVGELFFLDTSLVFTAEDLSRAPAEVLGRSSHGTSYKATLDDGHMLTVKWLRVGLVKCKKEFAKEAKRIGAIKHPNIISLRGYYWGPREQERLLISDYVTGDSLALHLYESTPRRCAPLSFSQRLKIAVDVARCLYYLHHDRGLPHGNLKPTNIFLTGPDLTAQLTDYGLHRLVTLNGIAEQILNLGALGYRAPELVTAAKPFPSFKADIYSFGVIMMELLTKRSAGDIISGQSGAVDLTDWVRLCAREGRGTECFDRDITGLEEAPRAMDDLLGISLRCILPVNERPNIRTVFDDLCSITI